MADEVHISSLLVHTRPEHVAAVLRGIRELGCEVHGNPTDGKLVVTVEARSGGELGSLLTDLQLLPHVLAATLVYHHVEPLADIGAAVPEIAPCAPVNEALT